MLKLEAYRAQCSCVHTESTPNVFMECLLWWLLVNTWMNGECRHDCKITMCLPHSPGGSIDCPLNTKSLLHFVLLLFNVKCVQFVFSNLNVRDNLGTNVIPDKSKDCEKSATVLLECLIIKQKQIQAKNKHKN